LVGGLQKVKRRPYVFVAEERSLKVSLPVLSEGDCWLLNGQDHAAVGAVSNREAAARMHNALLRVMQETFILKAERSGRTGD
jgi:hypothetical protein